MNRRRWWTGTWRSYCNIMIRRRKKLLQYHNACNQMFSVVIMPPCHSWTIEAIASVLNVHITPISVTFSIILNCAYFAVYAIQKDEQEQQTLSFSFFGGWGWGVGGSWGDSSYHGWGWLSDSVSDSQFPRPWDRGLVSSDRDIKSNKCI